VRVGTLHLMTPTMHHETDSWLFADWAVFGAQIPHWAMVIGGLFLVALLVAWFERPKRGAKRLTPRAAADYETSVLPERSVSRSR
jgi:hypothetical protein